MALSRANCSARTLMERRLRDVAFDKLGRHLSISPDASLLPTLHVMHAFAGTLAQAIP